MERVYEEEEVIEDEVAVIYVSSKADWFITYNFNEYEDDKIPTEIKVFAIVASSVAICFAFIKLYITFC